MWAELLSHALLVHCLVKLFVHYLFIQLNETFAFLLLTGISVFHSLQFPMTDVSVFNVRKGPVNETFWSSSPKR